MKCLVLKINLNDLIFPLKKLFQVQEWLVLEYPRGNPIE